MPSDTLKDIAIESRAIRLSAADKRVCFWGAPAVPNPQFDQDTPWKTRMQGTGGNSGNLFIGHGLFQNTDASVKTYHPGFEVLSPEAFDDNFDHLFIPASNFINPSLDMNDHYEYFRRTKSPMLCFGLGSQVVPGEPLSLKRGTEFFLRLMAERSNTIGVRGAFTADKLWSIGIRNLSLTGCPSLLSLGNDTILKLERAPPSLERLAVNYSNNVRSHSFDPNAQRQTENSLFARMLDENSYYILQNEAAELTLLDAIRDADSAQVEQQLRILGGIFESDPTAQSFKQYLLQKLRVFYRTDQWVGSMSTMGATVGTRFHGTIASILAGTPSLVLAHDMRTLELAQLFAIPHLVLDRPYAAEEVIERLLAVDYRPFGRRIGQLRMEWSLFAERNGIGVTWH